MKKFNKHNKPVIKATIEELCTSWVDKPCDRWISDEECIETICELIQIGVFDLDDMRWLLFYPDYCKVCKAFNEQKIPSEQK
jgi:hypothetical protein